MKKLFALLTLLVALNCPAPTIGPDVVVSWTDTGASSYTVLASQDLVNWFVLWDSIPYTSFTIAVVPSVYPNLFFDVIANSGTNQPVVSIQFIPAHDANVDKVVNPGTFRKSAAK